MAQNLLDEIVHRLTADPKVPVSQGDLTFLSNLRDERPDAFAKVVKKLRETKVTHPSIDQLAASNMAKPPRPKGVGILVDLADGTDLFHDAAGIGYADVEVADHRETLVLGRPPFRRWLTRGYYKQTGSAPSGDALTAAIATLQAKSHFDGPEREVFIR